MIRLEQYYHLWQLAQKRLQSEEDYRRFQAFQAKLMLNYFGRHQISLSGKRLVDLGSGIAGYSQYFAGQADQVISLDFTQPRQATRLNIRPVYGDALQIPLSDQSVDLVVCASLIEHVATPARVIAEIERVLKIGGICYLSFPPFYSPVGGHEFAPFHYLGETLALRCKKRARLVPGWVQQLYQVPTEPQSFAELYPGWGLYKMTIRKARSLLARSKLRQIDLSTRYLPLSLARWPLLGELLTWHVQFLLVRVD